MTKWVMVDSSAWVHALRRNGDAGIRARVQLHLTNRTAAWCGMVRLELWSGVRNDVERAALLQLDKTLPLLPIDENIWNTATTYASKARETGVTVPANDLLIFACAKAYGLPIEHADRHYDLLEQMK